MKNSIQYWLRLSRIKHSTSDKSWRKWPTPTIDTSLFTRMIHLELLKDLSAQFLARCLKQFFWRKRMLKFIISDNGKSFKASYLKNFITKKGISWKFNLARASWWSGLIEIVGETASWRTQYSNDWDWRHNKQLTSDISWGKWPPPAVHLLFIYIGTSNI